MSKYRDSVEKLDRVVDTLRAQIMSLNGHAPSAAVDPLREAEKRVRSSRDTLLALDHDAERGQ